MCSETSVVPTAGEFGVEFANADGGIAFVKLIRRQSPTLARRTIGRGLLPGRSWMLFPVPVVSRLKAKMKALGIVAPRRFSIIAFGIATTSALIMRVPEGHCCNAGAGAAAGAVVFAFAGSASVVTGPAGLSSFVLGVGVVEIFASVSGTALLDSAGGLSSEVVGVCAAASEAVSKLKQIAASEVKRLVADLKRSISLSFFALLNGDTSRLEDQ